MISIRYWALTADGRAVADTDLDARTLLVGEGSELTPEAEDLVLAYEAQKAAEELAALEQAALKAEQPASNKALRTKETK